MLLFHFLAIILLHGAFILAFEERTPALDKETAIDKDTHNDSQPLEESHEDEGTGRGFWNPGRLLTPIIGSLLGTFLRPSFKSFAPNIEREGGDIGESDQGGSPHAGLSYYLPKLLERLGMITRRKDPRIETCNEIGGVLINGECNEYFGQGYLRSFEEARAFCQAKKGDLWTPDLRDPFLYQKLMKYIPQIAAAKGEDLWLGVYQYNGRAFSVNGEDVTDAYLIQIYDDASSNGQCFVLDYPNGHFKAQDILCQTKQEFICEYPMTAGNEISSWHTK